MAIDVRGFITQHPAVTVAVEGAVDALIDALAIATEDALKVAIGAIPLVGGAIETVAAPFLDRAEQAVDAALKAKLADLIGGAALVKAGSGVAGIVEVSSEPSKG